MKTRVPFTDYTWPYWLVFGLACLTMLTPSYRGGWGWFAIPWSLLSLAMMALLILLTWKLTKSLQEPLDEAARYAAGVKARSILMTAFVCVLSAFMAGLIAAGGLDARNPIHRHPLRQASPGLESPACY